MGLVIEAVIKGTETFVLAFVLSSDSHKLSKGVTGRMDSFGWWHFECCCCCERRRVLCVGSFLLEGENAEYTEEMGIDALGVIDIFFSDLAFCCLGLQLNSLFGFILICVYTFRRFLFLCLLAFFSLG